MNLLQKLFNGIKAKKNIILWCSLLSLSANTSGKQLLDISEFPVWFQEADKRIIEIKTETSIEIDTFNVNANIKGKAQLTALEDGTWYYIIDIGTNAPVECYSFSSFDGPANSLHNLIDVSLELVEEVNNKKLTSQFNYALDVGIIADTPYIAFDTFYNLSDGKETASGVLKAISARTNNSLQLCIHNEVGYQSAFNQVFSSIVSAFVQNEANSEFFETTSKLIVNGLAVGYSREKYRLDDDGDIYFQSEEATIFPNDSNTVSRLDSMDHEFSRIDGSLINKETYVIENGELTSEFALTYQDGQWHVKGQLQGETIDLSLEYSDWLMSSFGKYIKWAKLQENDEKAVDFKMWLPSFDPTTAVHMELKKSANNKDMELQISFGAFKIDIVAKEYSEFQQKGFSTASPTMDSSLMYEKGSLKLP